ncbi:MAG: 50S ribosomal protein L4 [Phycisphaerales bacterium]|nr:50S ribosomal protein L4 [Phycisphaerales bacterium]
MIDIPVLDTKGKKVGSEQVDPEQLGGRVRFSLLKQAVVAYRANQRQGTVMTKSRGMVQGSARKLYRQKGTGRARAGNLRTPVRRGGGRTFAKVNRDFSQKLNRKMRRLARNSAILAKAMSGSALILNGLKLDAPKTSEMAKIMRATQTNAGALIALASADPNLQKSGRNIPALDMKLIQDVNAYDILRARHLVFTPEAFKALMGDPLKAGRSAEA